jgi:FdhE protein
MQALEAAVAANPWPLRRERAAELAERYPHAAEMLRLYQALIDHLPPPLAGDPQGIPSLAVEHVLPGVIDATVEFGPRALRDGVVALFVSENMEDLIQRWLDQQPLNPIETYLARASASPLLEAMSPSSFPSSSDSLHCPQCGGLPQLSYFAVSGEALVSGPRYLVCSRCATNWIFSRMMCAGCGESDGTKLPIFQEQERLPHARVDGCQTCRKYLLTFDLRRDTRAVPVVDEIAALPLDLYARDQGFTKITANLMGN